MVEDYIHNDGVKSPCINICQIHPVTGYCVGCFRTRDEIALWKDASDAAKTDILDALPGRASAHKDIKARPSKRKNPRNRL